MYYVRQILITPTSSPASHPPFTMTTIGNYAIKSECNYANPIAQNCLNLGCFINLVTVIASFVISDVSEVAWNTNLNLSHRMHYWSVRIHSPAAVPVYKTHLAYSSWRMVFTLVSIHFFRFQTEGPSKCWKYSHKKCADWVPTFGLNSTKKLTVRKLFHISARVSLAIMIISDTFQWSNILRYYTILRSNILVPTF